MRIVAGEFRNRKIKVPEGLDVRPTTSQVREAVFNICQHTIAGARFLDIFAGSGAMGFEALSRGAEFAVFIDNSKNSIRCITDNAKELALQNNVSVLYGDAYKLLPQLDKRGEPFDIVYIDPPYDLDDPDCYLKLLNLLDESRLIKPEGRVFVEAMYKAKINLPLEGYQNLTFRDKRRFGIAELFQFIYS